MAIVRSDKIQAGYNGNMESIKFAAQITNGYVCHVGSLVAGERELKTAVKPTTESIATKEIVMVIAPEVVYDSQKVGLKDFTIPAGQAARAYHFTEGDIVTLTVDLFTATPTVGEFVVPANDSWLLAPIADPTGVRFVAEVIEKTTLGYDATEAYAIEVKNV